MCSPSRGPGVELAGHPVAVSRRLDVRGLLCPLPVRRARALAAELPAGWSIELVGDDPAMEIDVPAWCHEDGHHLASLERRGRLVVAQVVLGPDDEGPARPRRDGRP